MGVWSDPLRCLKDQLYAVPHPDVFWYHLNGMGAQKICPQKIWDTSTFPQMHWASNTFGHSVTTVEVFWASLNYSILNFKKIVCPKNIWMRHLYTRFIFNNYRSFVNLLLQLVRSYVVMVFTYVKVATAKLRKTRSLAMQLPISY